MECSLEMSWQDVRNAFKAIWGYEDFRPPQGDVVRMLLSGQDALVVMPTGGGKSICFQLPALLQTGVTLVVSPLVALMENQVQELQQRRQPAALLHSQLPTHQRRRILNALANQQLRLLYLSPETLLSQPVWERLQSPQLKINGLILDEAHCLVQWGETFRPAYRRLGAVRPALLQTRPAGTRMAIAAFTATADPKAQQTIQQVLQLKQPQRVQLSPYRPNLHLSVKMVWTPRGRRKQLQNFIHARRAQAGLVYVRTRKDSQQLATWLQSQGYKTAAYHAGLSPEARRTLEQAWLRGKMAFVVCTSAFGMGINKPDARWVIHFHAPLLLSEYVQEVGRAGRDGQPAVALTLVSEPSGWLNPEDRQRRHFFRQQVRSQQQSARALVRKLPTTGNIQTVMRQFQHGGLALAWLHSRGLLEWQDPFNYVMHASVPTQTPFKLSWAPPDDTRLMTQYLATRQCRWQFLLRSFGLTAEAIDFRCNHCDSCIRKQ
ncbi:MAG: ATP-dependent DNA helicase RecQ [Cyanothece sp. SIO1E1]|nr:ATP-dependent DNA helicase RecQ [Cyanothece sp. SIO1E1]